MLVRSGHRRCWRRRSGRYARRRVALDELADRRADLRCDVGHRGRYNCLAHDDRLAGGRALLKGALHGGHEMARIGINLLGARARSEEHTSELQSLMRISYAVFCLQKKTKNNTRKNDN